ncbi:hypothetical protein B0H11DRAFT_2259753 [Mycena galericulata]|nr:hypothetical protein B0H11DRAFT_2259753 [Mycena galericulata]
MSPPKEKKPPSDIPQALRLTKAMKEVGTSRLEEFRFLIWSEASDRDFGLTPLAEFLPDIMIKIILDNFVRYKTTSDLTEVVRNLAGMLHPLPRLPSYKFLVGLWSQHHIPVIHYKQDEK